MRPYQRSRHNNNVAVRLFGGLRAAFQGCLLALACKVRESSSSLPPRFQFDPRVGSNGGCRTCNKAAGWSGRARSACQARARRRRVLGSSPASPVPAGSAPREAPPAHAANAHAGDRATLRPSSHRCLDCPHSRVAGAPRRKYPQWKTRACGVVTTVSNGNGRAWPGPRWCRTLYWASRPDRLRCGQR